MDHEEVAGPRRNEQCPMTDLQKRNVTERARRAHKLGALRRDLLCKKGRRRMVALYELEEVIPKRVAQCISGFTTQFHNVISC